MPHLKLASIIFFIAFVQMMYYLGVMQWVIKNLYVKRFITAQRYSFTIVFFSAWFFFKIMNVSGAEAVVAAASPWIGQGLVVCHGKMKSN